MLSAKEEIKMRFMRITLIGASDSGKTALISSYVNKTCPYRNVKTDKAVVYYRKVDIDDDSDTGVLQPVLVEIEDTPGSERGNEDDDEDSRADASGEPPKVRVGARVILEKDRNKLINLFDEYRAKGGKGRYRPAMDGMLGKEFTVKTQGKDGTFGIPSPDGSEGGVWDFPTAALILKVSMSLPIDAFLNLGEKAKPEFASLKERKQYAIDLHSPFLAYPRPVGAPDMDKTMTRNRMGYFICFDLADDDGGSLKEAMTVYQMLLKALENKKGVPLKPIIWLVGCKEDRASEGTMQRNYQSAGIWSESQEIPLYKTSAKNHKGVDEVFNDMLKAISSRENLWNVLGVDGEENDSTKDDEGNCSLQ